MTGDHYGVRWAPLYSLSFRPIQPHPPESPSSDFENLYPEAKHFGPGEHPFDVPYARRRYTFLIEPAIYLAALLRDFLLMGGRLEVRDFRSLEELAGIKESLIFNCTGLGARALFRDEELTPIKGQLTFLLPQPEIDYMTVGPGNIYMFPRRDGILLGGSHERGEWSTDPDPAVTDRILRENGVLFGRMRD
jgi:hypothetical protein